MKRRLIMWGWAVLGGLLLGGCQMLKPEPTYSFVIVNRCGVPLGSGRIESDRVDGMFHAVQPDAKVPLNWSFSHLPEKMTLSWRAGTATNVQHIVFSKELPYAHAGKVYLNFDPGGKVALSQ